MLQASHEAACRASSSFPKVPDAQGVPLEPQTQPYRAVRDQIKTPDPFQPGPQPKSQYREVAGEFAS